MIPPASNCLVVFRESPLKNIFVNWDDELPNWMENQPNVPNHQPEYGWWQRKLSWRDSPKNHPFSEGEHYSPSIIHLSLYWFSQRWFWKRRNSCSFWFCCERMIPAISAFAKDSDVVSDCNQKSREQLGMIPTIWLVLEPPTICSSQIYLFHHVEHTVETAHDRSVP